MKNDTKTLISEEKRKSIEYTLDALLASYRQELKAKRIRKPARGKRNWSLYAFNLEGKSYQDFWNALSFLSNSEEPLDFEVFDPDDFPEIIHGDNPDSFEIGTITVSGDYEKLHEKLWNTYVLGMESNITNPSIKSGQPIYSIACVAPEEFREHFTVIVNENYSSPIKANKKTKYWSLLLSVTNGKSIKYEADEHRNSINTLNYIQDCSLYTQSGCVCTKVVVVEGRYITAAPNVNIKTIGKKMFTQNINKLKAT